MIHKLVISSSRNKIAFDASWRIIPNLSILQRKTVVVQTNTCTSHKRFFHNSIICLQKNQPLKENNTDTENISALKIKNRLTRRNRPIISNDKIPKPNVSLLASRILYLQDND